jgi:uncharacterized phage protein (TIGR02218 family)
MKTAPTAVKIFLNSLMGPGANRKFFLANLYTVTLIDGRVFRWTDAQTDLTVGGNMFSSGDPFFKFKGQKSAVGLQTQSLDLEIFTAGTTLIGGTPILRAVLDGVFDDALVLREVIIMPTYEDVSLGQFTMFRGNWSEVKGVDRAHVSLTVRSRLELLNKPFPIHVYSDGCRWPHYGAGCTLSKAAFGIAGTLAGTPDARLFSTTLANPDNYFSQGSIKFTSGANSGLEFSIRFHLSAGGEILLFTPLPEPPAPGDTFTAYPGCDHTFPTCGTKFSNAGNYGGEDLIPIAETAA